MVVDQIRFPLQDLFRQEGHLKKGNNPFNEDQERIELKFVHPLFEKMCNKLKIKFEKHYKLSKKCFVDYKIQIPNKPKSDMVELKQSKKFLSNKNQLARYNAAKNLKQHNIDQFYKADPKGSHKSKGFLSFKELKKTLQNEINHYRSIKG